MIPFTFWFTPNESGALVARKVDVTIVFDGKDFEQRKTEQHGVEEVMENIRVSCVERLAQRVASVHSSSELQGTRHDSKAT